MNAGIVLRLCSGFFVVASFPILLVTTTVFTTLFPDICCNIFILIFILNQSIMGPTFGMIGRWGGVPRVGTKGSKSCEGLNWFVVKVYGTQCYLLITPMLTT
jgi:hypothetical protein